MKFEQFLQDNHADQYQGLDDEMPDDFEEWITDLDVEQWLAFGEEYTKDTVRKFKKLWEAMDTIGKNLSPCCNAKIDESKVIPDGMFKGHGPRYCSKCSKLTHMV